MSDDLKSDILKAVADSNKPTNDTLKEPVVTPVFKDPQVLQHSLDKALQGQIETRDAHKK